MKNTSTPITELLTLIVDNRGKTVPTTDKGMPLIATNCIKHRSIYPTFESVRYVDNKTMERWFRAHPKPNDIIFVNKGTPGRVCLVPDPVPFCFAQDMIGFRCDSNKIDFEYLFAVLRSDYIQKTIENFHVGLVIPHFKKGDLHNLKIPRLNTRDQEYSVGKLYLSLSKKIELNNCINAELVAMAKTLYDYWFVQFNFPNANGKPYKTSGGKMVYYPTLKREIPKGWEVKKLIEITSMIRRGISPKYVEQGGTIVLNQKCVRDQRISFEDARRHGVELFDEDERLLKRFDVLVNSTGVGTLGRVAYVKRLLEKKTTCDSHITIVRASADKISPEYLSWTLMRHQPMIETAAYGSTGQVELSKKFLEDIDIVIPSKLLVDKFADLVNPVISKIAAKEAEIETLVKLRDWLLPMLMNGQVTLKA